MVESVAAELLPLTSLDKAEVEGYWREFTENGETENVLWELATLSIDEYYERQGADRRNRRFGFLVGGALVGMVRISSRINHEANGKVGYSIRPSRRKRLYAPTLLRLAEEYCHLNCITPVTACVDVTNEASLKAFRLAGFAPTGREFDWTYQRRAVELSLPEHLNNL